MLISMLCIACQIFVHLILSIESQELVFQSDSFHSNTHSCHCLTGTCGAALGRLMPFDVWFVLLQRVVVVEQEYVLWFRCSKVAGRISVAIPLDIDWKRWRPHAIPPSWS
eukprot:1112608_1